MNYKRYLAGVVITWGKLGKRRRVRKERGEKEGAGACSTLAAKGTLEGAGQQVRLDFSYHLTEEPEQTFWPAQ